MPGSNDRLINNVQGNDIITALQAIASKSQSPYSSTHKLNPKYINYDSYHANITEEELNMLDIMSKICLDEQGYIGIDYGVAPTTP